MKKTDVLKQTLLDHLDSVFHDKAWHGASLLDSIRKVDFERATMENAEGYSPWKIVLHCAYWKFYVRRLITLTGERPTFPRKPRDFPRLPAEISPDAWKSDKEFLVEQHALLREAVAAFPLERLDETPPKGRFTYAGYILGAAAHDVYHTAHLRNLGVLAF